MELRFNAEEWAGRKPDERARQCRQMADKVRALTRNASSPDLKSAYSTVAAEWEKLAQEIERWLPE
jgi:hypothetical protein